MKTFLLISGATGGLGSAFAIDCAKRGYDLLLTDFRPEGADLARFLNETFHIDARFKQCDLTSYESRTSLYESFKSEGYRFWGLINVAGTDYEGDFMSRTRGQILNILRLNVESTLDTTHAILKLRDPERRFILINVCSLAAYNPMPYKAIYAATKRFLLDFTLAIAEEIRDFGNATALCPAGLPTTPEVMRAIFAQGFWGQITTMDTHVVAHKTFDRALKGKTVYVPGIVSQIIQSIAHFVPRRVVVRLIGKRWKSAQERPYEWHFSPHSEVAEVTKI
jgi:short-subunit dehydrogenase